VNIQDLELGLEKCRLVAECLNFVTVSNTSRTITLSPKDRSALKEHGNLIFDLSIMATSNVRQVGFYEFRADDQIKEEFCLMITLNNERQNAVFLYGVSTGLSVYRRFGEFLCGTIDNWLTMDSVLKAELTRAILNGMRLLWEDFDMRSKFEEVANFLEKSHESVVKVYESKSTTDSQSAADQAFSA
jgi:hypothetical protein